MSRIFGAVCQNGYVVRDIRAAMDHWVKVMGVGPWYYIPKVKTDYFRHRGQDSAMEMSVALANSGDLQIELIQQRNDAPSMYRDFLANGPEGLQHVSTWPADYEGTVKRALAAGHRIGQQGESNRGPFAYFDTEGRHRGTCMEIAAYTEVRKRQFDAIEAAARAWDGKTDPIRTKWPE